MQCVMELHSLFYETFCSVKKGVCWRHFLQNFCSTFLKLCVMTMFTLLSNFTSSYFQKSNLPIFWPADYLINQRSAAVFANRDNSVFFR